MSENQSQNTSFDAANLKMTKDGPVYDNNRTVSLQEAFTKISGGKRYKDEKEAFKDMEISLKELVK
jgi:hypothetical protein